MHIMYNQTEIEEGIASFVFCSCSDFPAISLSPFKTCGESNKDLVLAGSNKQRARCYKFKGVWKCSWFVAAG